MALPPPLSATDEKYVSILVDDYFIRMNLLTRSFAYETIKDRLPLIVTRIVDFLARHRANISKEYGDVSDVVFFLLIRTKFFLGSRK
jgi:hypothetical protein